jgi:hypothetical protein
VSPREQLCRGFDGYVDAEFAGVGGGAWIFDATRKGDGSEVDRYTTLNATAEQEVLETLPTVHFPSSTELAREPPQLVRELLELPGAAALGGASD